MPQHEAPRATMARLDMDSESDIQKTGITLAPASENEPEVIQKLRAKGYVFERVDTENIGKDRNPI